MNKELGEVAERIRAELVLIERVVARCQGAWEQSKLSSDDYDIDSVALNLHAFYSGLERLFELTARVVDGKLPQGANWHQVLLEQMRAEIRGIRPAVLSSASKNRLDKFRSFRHVVRNVYPFTLGPTQLAKLMEILGSTFSIVQRELLAFADSLERSASEEAEED